MRVGFGEKFARASRHVRGAWQTKAEQRQKVSQRNQHFLAKRRSLLLSSVEPSTSARTKARVHASHGGPSRGIATPGRARSEREPTAFGCRARARPACFERPRRRPRPRSPRVVSFATRRVPSPTRGITPPDPRVSAPVAAAHPTTAANKSTAQWRVYTDVARDLSSRGDLEAAGVYLRRALAEAKAGFGEDDPHVAAARNNLAELYRLQRRFDEAEKLYAVAAAALEKHYGPSHPAAGAAVHNWRGAS